MLVSTGFLVILIATNSVCLIPNLEPPNSSAQNPQPSDVSSKKFLMFFRKFYEIVI